MARLLLRGFDIRKGYFDAAAQAGLIDLLRPILKTAAAVSACDTFGQGDVGTHYLCRSVRLGHGSDGVPISGHPSERHDLAFNPKGDSCNLAGPD